MDPFYGVCLARLPPQHLKSERLGFQEDTFFEAERAWLGVFLCGLEAWHGLDVF